MTSAPILITGATGTTGSRLVAQLLTRDVDVRAASRSGDGEHGLRFDWHDDATWDEALRDVQRTYLLPPPGPDPAAVMLPFLDRALAAGVQRAVVHSASVIAPGDPGMGVVQATVAERFPEWATVRPSWFMQNVTGSHPLGRSIRASRTLTTCTGDARVAFVDAEDIAAVAAQLLVAETALDDDVILTGPQALSYADVAAILSEACGEEIPFVAADPDEVQAMYEQLGFSADEARFLVMLESIEASGVEDRTTDAVQRVIGRPPRSFREFAAAEFHL